MRRIIDLVAKTSDVFAACAFFLFLAAILGQVAYRYLGLSLIFSEELARLLNVYVVFIGIIAVTRFDGHVRIDLLERFLKDNVKLRRALRAVHLAGAFLFLVIVAIGAWELTIGGWNYRLATMAWLSQGHIYLAPFIGASISAFVILLRLIDACRFPEQLEDQS